MRLLTWVTPEGITRTVAIGGQRRRPLQSRQTQSLDSFEQFLEDQRDRVALDLQKTLWRVQASRNDGMSPSHIRSETIITRRG